MQRLLLYSKVRRTS